MRDLGLVAFLFGLIALGFRRPFLFVLAYVYIDVVSPQRLSYYLLNSLPVSMIAVVLAVGGWVLADDKRDTRIAPRQVLLLMLLGWAAFTTANADFPVEALEKWNWVWKALAFAIFLPFTLRTRLRIEALCLFLVLCAASIIIVGGIKTVASGGGGYGTLNLMIDNNSGLYEGSTISMVAIAIIPLILWLMKEGTIFPPDWRVKAFGGCLIFACLLMPIGTSTRTGLVCIALLGVLMLRTVKRRLLYLSIIGVLGLVAVPLLPASFTGRMETIKTYKGDQSASTRLAVWAWTLDYVGDHPLGGGFNAYLQNHIQMELEGEDAGGTVSAGRATDAGRAYHSAYFEMLGEQGWPGLIMWLTLQAAGLARMEVLRRRYRDPAGPHAWAGGLAAALQTGQFVYLLGAAFVGIAFQPFVYMLIGAQIGLDTYLGRQRRDAAPAPFARPAQRVTPATA